MASLIVEGCTLAFHCLLRNNLTLVDSSLIGNHTTSPPFYITIVTFFYEVCFKAIICQQKDLYILIIVHFTFI